MRWIVLTCHWVVDVLILVDLFEFETYRHFKIIAEIVKGL